jgi:hypothetical protein
MPRMYQQVAASDLEDEEGGCLSVDVIAQKPRKEIWLDVAPSWGDEGPMYAGRLLIIETGFRFPSILSLLAEPLSSAVQDRICTNI